jgi:predicted AAA+ superfamily ATPase
VFKRLQVLPDEQHLFLFGARATGKSTLLAHQFTSTSTLTISFLNPENELRFARQPNDLVAIAEKLPEDCTHIVLDEIQKLPVLLDVVHGLIEAKIPQYFIMTGSSARKLRHGGANLLAGRALVYSLFPFSYLELGEAFDLNQALMYGLLPKIQEHKSDPLRRQFLNAYAHTYLKEEIWAEQVVKNLDPFRKFLEVAAQSNGKIINFANIARDVGVSDNTVHEYFSILDDTLLGFFLEGFHHSFRKRLQSKPKFYFFDMGVVRSLTRSLRIPLQEGTSVYGEVFEHFIILECVKLANYYQLDYRFCYLETKDGAEVDLVVDRPGQPYLFIEIKSTTQVQPEHVKTLSKMAKDIKNAEAICLSRDPYQKQYDNVTVYPWQQGIKTFFTEEAN